MKPAQATDKRTGMAQRSLGIAEYYKFDETNHAKGSERLTAVPAEALARTMESSIRLRVV